MPRNRLLPALTLFAFACPLVPQSGNGSNGAAQFDAAQLKNPLKTQDAQPLTVSTNVSDNVQVEAVLLPPDVCKHVFGTRISKGYAAVELIISNHSPNAAFVLESAFLDYSQWLLNGVLGEDSGDKTVAPKASDPEAPNPPRPKYDSSTLKGQVASAEARLVRSDLQDHQPFTGRNLVVNGIIAVGSVAVGYDFLATSMNYTRGIAAFQGVFAPAISALWPDQTQLQLNRISDFGFRTPHLVPKDSSDIVVAFYPLDRFLTPGLKKAFLTSPAIFFVPGSALSDVKTRHFLLDPMRAFGLIDKGASDDTAAETIAKAILHKPADCVGSNEKACNIREFVRDTSLNRIHLTVSGNMQVDLDAVPAIITDVTFDQDKTAASTWEAATKTPRTGTIIGTFLGGGTPSLVDPPDGFGPLTKNPDNSNDSHIAFSFTPTKDVPPDTVLNFVVTKKSKDGTSTSSAKLPFTVPKYTPTPKPAPAADGTQQPATITTPPPGQAVPNVSVPQEAVGAAAAGKKKQKGAPK